MRSLRSLAAASLTVLGVSLAGCADAGGSTPGDSQATFATDFLRQLLAAFLL